MTKSDFIEKLSLKLRHLSKNEVESIVDTVLGKMTNALREGRRIEVRGFGTFELRERPARVARNPKTGKVVTLNNRYVPFFKVGKELFERINSVQPVATSAKNSAVSESAPTAW